MRKILNLALLASLSVLVAGPSFAQPVAYNGKLQIGFGDQDNATGFRSNNAVPICAGAGPVKNPGTIGTTIGTLLVNARGSAVPGAGGALTFNAATDTVGGAQQKENATCVRSIPGFANPRLRSRTQVGAAAWPGRKGPFTTMIADAPVPATPTATYMLSANNGNLQPITVNAWSTKANAAAPTNFFTGSAFSRSVPFFGTGAGVERFQPGPARFGGGVPYSGGGGVQLGINFAIVTPGGDPLQPGDYGLVLYANGFLPTDPQLFGTDAKGWNILNPVTNTIYTTGFTYTAGLVNGDQANTYAARTPGGSTRDQQGKIRTVGGGNTVTQMGTFMAGIPHPTLPPPATLPLNCVTMVPAPCPAIISPVAFTGAFYEWTTGAVTHTDRGGDFVTIRKASGFDVATAGPNGTTRRLQLVAPWAATIRPVGPFGLPVPELAFGGLSILSLNVIPVPEPGTLAMLGFGIAGLVGLGAARRRNG